MKIIIALLTVTALTLGIFLFERYQQRARAQAPMLPVTFAHKTHQSESCISCHHNYVDDSGQGLCFECHKTDPTVAALVETQFHQLCWGCHVEKQADGNEHGPTRRCNACHTADDDP